MSDVQRSYWGGSPIRERGTQVNGVIRDFIPADDELSDVEREKQKMLRAMGSGRRIADFIPGPDHELKPPSGAEAQAEEAIARAVAAQASSMRTEYQAAVTKLKGLNVGNAIEVILQAPPAVAELLLVAEKMNGNRKSITDRFGEVDPAAVARWASVANDGATNEATEGTADEAKAEDAED